MAENEQEGGGGKLATNKLIILIVAGVLLLAAGGGTYFLMKGQMAESEDENDKKHKKHENVSLYYDMSKPFVVDFPKGSSMDMVQLAATFVVEDQETTDALKKNEPMLRNNLLMVISSQTPDKLNTSEGKEQLRSAMLAEVAATLKKLNVHGEVTEVLFTSFIMQ